MLQRVRRPFAWTVLVVGLTGVVLTFPFGVLTAYGEPEFWITLAGFFLLALDGYDKVMEVEFDDEGEPVEENA